MKPIVTVLILWFNFFGQCFCDEYEGEAVDWYPTPEYYKYYPRIGDCFEIYPSTEKVTPFNCRIPINVTRHSCVELRIDEDGNHCLVLSTPSNETLKLLCGESEQLLLSYHLDTELNTCFNVSKPEGDQEEICQKTFDTYSIGVTTPDNFTVLLDSNFCTTSLGKGAKEKYGNFTDNFSFDHHTRSCYKIYAEGQDISPYTCFDDDVIDSCIGDLPEYKNCEGIVTQNNETVVLHCSGGPGEEALPNNCFKIYTADKEPHVSCLKKVEERCVGFTTPSNLTVLVECYFCSKPSIKKYSSYNAEKQKLNRKFVKAYLNDELSKKNSYLGKLEFEIVNARLKTVVYGYWLPGSDCYGFTLDSNETVILECVSGDSSEKFTDLKPGCFPVIHPQTSPEEQQAVCVKIVDEECVGIVVKNWTVALACNRLKETNEISHEEFKKTEYLQKNAESYKLSPRLESCYEVYSSEEINPYACRKSSNPKNYTCIDWILGEDETPCLGLEMPNEEVVILLCGGDTREEVLSYKTFSTIKNCFTTYSQDVNLGEVCQKKFGNYSIGITSPSNYSILFDSLYCSPEKPPELSQQYKEFIGNFTFDPNLRSCYKVFDKNQEVGPYTCLNDHAYDACVRRLENTDCFGIVTQNDEKIILDCFNGVKAVNESGCVKIITPDGVEHVGCPEQVEEQCVGIVTPSNLTVLLECDSCLSTRGGSELPRYTDENRKSFRSSVNYFLYTVTHFPNALENETTLPGYNPNQDIKLNDCDDDIKDYEIHTLRGHGSCRGITLDSLETIVLECSGEIPEKLGCYDIFEPVYEGNKEIIGPDHKVGNVCVKILNEWCVGIRTPSNWTVTLNCYKPSQDVCPLRM